MYLEDYKERPPTLTSCLPCQTPKPYHFPSLHHPGTPSSKDPNKNGLLHCPSWGQALLTSFWISLLRAEIFIFMSSSSWSGKGCTWGLASDSSGDGNTRSARGMYHLQSYCWCFLQTNQREMWAREEFGSSGLNCWNQTLPERDLLRTHHRQERSSSLRSLIRKHSWNNESWVLGSGSSKGSGPWACHSSGPEQLTFLNSPNL